MVSNGNRLGRIATGGKALLRGLWSEEGTLGQKAARGGVWLMGSTAVTKLLGMVQTVILVRLLVPADFGVMRVAGFLLAAIATFTQTGMGAAVVQRKEIDDATLNTAWTIGIIRNAMLFGAVFLLAPWAARFYDNPVICPILRLVGVRFVLGGLGNIGVVLLRRELNFRRHELLEVICNALAIILTVAVGFWLRSVWALAIGWVAFSCIKLVGSYIAHPYRPRLAFRWVQARMLLRFGVNLTGSGILIFLSTQGDDAVVGKIVGLTALGYYTLAFTLSNLPVVCISHVLGAVALPLYSRVQGDARRLRHAFGTVLRAVSLLALPASVGLFLLAPDLVRVVYGKSYLPMVTCFRVLILYGLLRALAATVGPVFVGVGKPRLDLVMQVVRFGLLAALIYPATGQWGITGAAAATVVSMAGCTGWAFLKVRQIVGADVLVRCFRELAAVAAATAVMALAVAALQSRGLATSAVGLLTTAASGALLYAAAMFALRPRLFARAKALAWNALS